MRNTTNMTKTLRYFLFILLALGVVLLILTIASQKQNKPELKAITFKTESGWGYRIVYRHKVIIQQENIPAITGNQSFSSENEAKRTAELVVNKLMNKQLPYISVRELDSLKVKY